MRIKVAIYLLLTVSINIVVNGQSNLLQVDHVVSPNITICGETETFAVHLYNPSPFKMTNAVLEIILPPGLNYVVGSIQNGSELNVATLNHPYFDIFDIDTLAYSSIYFEVEANCDLLNFASTGQILLSLARVDYTANSTSHSDDAQSATFNALKPNISILNVSNQAYSGEIGDTYTRCITVTNGGLGSLSSFTLSDLHGSGIQINGLNYGLWSTVDSTETILLSGLDFINIGDGDTLFENGEVIDICESVEILNCISVSSEFIATWGCDGQECQFSSSGANVLFPNLTPNISITPVSAMGICIGSNSPNKQQLIVTNLGSGLAKEITIEIFQAYGQSNFQSSQSSYIDETSITLTQNGATYSINPDSTKVNNISNGCSGTNIGMVYLSLPVIALDDTIIIEWNTYSCCPQGCVATKRANGWWYKGYYSNICNSNFIIPQKRGRTYSSLYANFVNNNSPATMNNGGTSNFSFLFTSYGNSYPKGPGSYYRYAITIPPCLVYAGGLQILNKDGVSILNPDSTNLIGDTLFGYFNANVPWSFHQAELMFDLTADCGNCSGGSSNISLDVYYIPSANCGCEIHIECNNFSTNVNCPAPCSEGLLFQSFKAERTSFGLPDNNEDGLSDGGGAVLDFTRVRKDRLMFGDTLSTIYKGVIRTDQSYPNWNYCYVEADISYGKYLTYIDADLTIYRSNGSVINCNVAPTISGTGNSRSYVYDLSASTLFGNGCSISLFNYIDNDSIVLVPRYKVTGNPGGQMLTSNIQNEFYISKIANPIASADKYQCNDIEGLFNLIGYYFTSAGSNTYTVNSCNQIEVSQNYYLSIGPCCSNYAGGNLFRAEYRNWAHIDTLEVRIPKGYTYISSRFSQTRTSGTGGRVTSPWEYPSPLFPANDTILTFDVEQYFDGYGGNIELSDDGFYGRLLVTLQPSCEVAGDSAINLVYDWTFAEGNYLTGSATSNVVVRSTHDNLLFEKPNLFIQSTLPIVSALNTIVSWDVSISNVTNFDADNFWLGVPLNSGIQVFEIVDLDNGSVLGNNISSGNDSWS